MQLSYKQKIPGAEPGWSIEPTIHRFCSRSCAYARGQTPELRELKSKKTKQAWVDERIVHTESMNRGLPESARLNSVKSRQEAARLRTIKALAEGRYEDLSQVERRRVLLEEAKYTCQSCGLDKWLDQKIWLEIHHKDDDNSNNRKENLMVVCLNCHAILDTNYRNCGR